MFEPREHKSGKWLRFELGQAPHLVAVAGGQVRRGALADPEDLELLLKKAKRSADGRLVGVFVKGGRLRVPAGKELIRGADGQPAHDPPQYKDTPERFVPIPDCVAPIRALLGPDGSHNLSFLYDGQAHTLLLALDTLQNVDLVLVRDDIPSYRDATLDENFDPAETARRVISR